jgi:hypothetical protein
MARYRLIHLFLVVTLTSMYFAWLRATIGQPFLLGFTLTCIFLSGLIAIHESRSDGGNAAMVVGSAALALAIAFPLVAR